MIEDKLREDLEQLKQNREQLIAQVNAVMGTINYIESVLKDSVPATETENKE